MIRVANHIALDALATIDRELQTGETSRIKTSMFLSYQVQLLSRRGAGAAATREAGITPAAAMAVRAVGEFAAAS